MSRTIKIIFIVILIIVLGSFRELLFVSINNQISFLYGEIPKNGLVNSMSFIENFSVNTLVTLKWVFTILYTVLFLFIGRYVLKNLFKSSKFAHWYTVVYTLLFILSGIFFCIGHFIGSTENMFSLARTLMGSLQSPVPLLIISPLLFLKKHF